MKTNVITLNESCSACGCHEQISLVIIPKQNRKISKFLRVQYRCKNCETSIHYPDDYDYVFLKERI